MMQMKVNGKTGTFFIIEASANLVNWEAAGVPAVSGDGSFDFEDTDAPKHQCRFYRVVVEP